MVFSDVQRDEAGMISRSAPGTPPLLVPTRFLNPEQELSAGRSWPLLGTCTWATLARWLALPPSYADPHTAGRVGELGVGRALLTRLFTAWTVEPMATVEVRSQDRMVAFCLPAETCIVAALRIDTNDSTIRYPALALV